MKNSLRKIAYIMGFAVTAVSGADQACYSVQGMTCPTCGITVRAAVKRIKGVNEVKVSVEDKTAVVQFDRTRTNSETIKKIIDGIGYEATTQDCKRN